MTQHPRGHTSGARVGCHDDKGHEDWNHPQAWAANSVPLFPLPLPCREQLIITSRLEPRPPLPPPAVSVPLGSRSHLQASVFLPVRWLCITPGCSTDRRGCDWSCTGVLQKPGAPKWNRGRSQPESLPDGWVLYNEAGSFSFREKKSES